MKTFQDMCGDSVIMVFDGMVEWSVDAKLTSTGEKFVFNFHAEVHVPPKDGSKGYSIPREFWTAEVQQKKETPPYSNFPWGKWQVFHEVSKELSIWVGECEYNETKRADNEAVMAVAREYVVAEMRKKHEKQQRK